MKKIIVFAGAVLLAFSCLAHAGIRERDLAKLKGYTILGSFTVTGWYDPGKKKGDSFEGCDYGRVIILDHRTKITCSTYSYSYSYQPSAILFGNGTDIKMLVDGEFYDMQE